MFKKLFNKSKKPNNEIYTEKDAIKFYELFRHYAISSPNIAVLGDKTKYKKLIQQYLKIFDYRKGATHLKINDNKIIFLSDDIEMTLVLIKNYNDLVNSNLKFRKYL